MRYRQSKFTLKKMPLSVIDKRHAEIMPQKPYYKSKDASKFVGKWTEFQTKAQKSSTVVSGRFGDPYKRLGYDFLGSFGSRPFLFTSSNYGIACPASSPLDLLTTLSFPLSKTDIIYMDTMWAKL